MSSPTVYARCKVVLEIPVRSSSSGETLFDLHRVAQKEAAAILDNMLSRERERGNHFRTVGPVEFVEAVVK